MPFASFELLPLVLLMLVVVVVAGVESVKVAVAPFCAVAAFVATKTKNSIESSTIY
jgi:hypothetical protein